jgi:hypothetical protein
LIALLQYPLIHGHIEESWGLLACLASSALVLVLSLALFLNIIISMIRHRTLFPDNITWFQAISCIVSPLIWVLSISNISDSGSNIEELKANYRHRRSAIYQMKHFTDAVTPLGYRVYVEFRLNGNIDFFVHVSDSTSRWGVTTLFQNWNIDYHNYRVPEPTHWDSSGDAPKIRSLDSALHVLGWDHQTLEQIKSHLEAADCISVETGDPTHIGYRRSGMGKYFYVIPGRPFPRESTRAWNDSSQYVFVSDSLVLEYGGGGFGNQSFPDFQKHP